MICEAPRETAKPAIGRAASVRARRNGHATLLAYAALVLMAAVAMAYVGMFVTDARAPASDPRFWLYALTHYPTTLLSPATVGTALLVGLAALATRGGRQFRRARPWRVLRTMFAPRYLAHRSHRLDALFFIANLKVFVLLFGWLILSGLVSSRLFYGLFVEIFGLPGRTSLSATTVLWLGGLVLFLAYEFGYWLDHYLAHRIAYLWDYHRVHHEAEALSPLTLFRVHPIDSTVYYNILALTYGIADAGLNVVLGFGPGEGRFLSAGIVIGIAAYVYLNLHHTHVWIAFTGLLGRILISPAHHQIHHSSAVEHHDRNMGNVLAVFDWMFGTLHMPTRRRQKLTFGVHPQADERHDPHTLEGALLAPFGRSAERVRAEFDGGREDAATMTARESASARS